MKRLLTGMSFLFLVIGCETRPDGSERLNVIRVFMHEPGDYSVMYQEGKEVKTLSLVCYRGVQVLADVPKGEPMYYEKTWKKHESARHVIHVHSPQDIKGGGWSNEDSHGQTIPIE